MWERKKLKKKELEQEVQKTREKRMKKKFPDKRRRKRGEGRQTWYRQEKEGRLDYSFKNEKKGQGDRVETKEQIGWNRLHYLSLSLTANI